MIVKWMAIIVLSAFVGVIVSQLIRQRQVHKALVQLEQDYAEFVKQLEEMNNDPS